MPRISIYKRRLSDQSGFKHWEIELVKQGPFKVARDEFDNPPPSRIPLGGEGDVSAGELRQDSSSSDGVSSTDTPSTSSNPVVYVTTAAGITASFTHPWMAISGSNTAISLLAQPQITRGQEGNVLTLQCVDSAVTLNSGSANAISFMDSRGSLTLTSGMVITFVYTTGGMVWQESSRFRP